MIHMTTRTVVRHRAALALFAISFSPRDAVASSFSLSSVNVGTGIVTGGGPDTITSAANVTGGAGHLASANTKLGLAVENPGFVTRHLRGGAKGATTGTGQIARAEASVQDAWNCPNCVFVPPVFPCR